MAKRNDQPKVYLATFPNGKQYVGITTATLELRKSEHESRAKMGSNYAIHNAIRKYGSPDWKVLNICSSYEEAKTLEKKYIKEFNTMAPNGYNLTEGGDGSKGHKLSDEQRKRLSDAHKGYVMPESQKAKISLANTGRKMSSQSIEKIRKGQKKTAVLVFKKDSNEFVGQWESSGACAKDLNLKRPDISRCLSGIRPSTKGYTIKRAA